MNCQQSENLLSARLDEELSPEEEAQLQAHLEGCVACQAVAAAMEEQDERLRGAFRLRRSAAASAAQKTLTELPKIQLKVPDTFSSESQKIQAGDEIRGSLPVSSKQAAGQIKGRVPFSSEWLPLGLAAAAGFLVAVLIFRPWQKSPEIVRTITQPSATTQVASTTQPDAVFTCGQLALATGKVEIRPRDSSVWRPMETGGSVPVDACVRTGDGIRCEFQMTDGSVVRLNQDSELRFAGSRRLELTGGQVWSGVAQNKTPFVVSADPTTITADSTRFDLSKTPEKTSLVVFDGAAQVKMSGTDLRVTSGQEMQIVAGRASQPRPVPDLSLAAQWIDELLLLKGRENPELTQRIDDLLARLGEDKMQYLYENEIRGLGDHCVLPLTRYIQSDRSAREPARRRRAAEILSDCAQPWCVPYLIELLSDHDGDVRAAAGRALIRVSHVDIGSDEQWRNASGSERAELIARWQQWWNRNKSHIPGASVPDSKDRSSSNKV